MAALFQGNSFAQLQFLQRNEEGGTQMLKQNIKKSSDRPMFPAGYYPSGFMSLSATQTVRNKNSTRSRNRPDFFAVIFMFLQEAGHSNIPPLAHSEQFTIIDMRFFRQVSEIRLYYYESETT